MNKMDYVLLAAAAAELVDFVRKKHGITSYNEFTCPYMRRLAMTVDRVVKPIQFKKVDEEIAA